MELEEINCNKEQISCSESCPCFEGCMDGCENCEYCVCLIPEDNSEYIFCKQYYEVRFLQCVEQCNHEQGNGTKIGNQFLTFLIIE